MRKTMFALSLAAGFGAVSPPLQAAEIEDSVGESSTGGDSRKAHRLEAMTVHAIPLDQETDQIVAPVEVLGGSALDDAKASTLGETVSGLPGVQTTAMGQAVGRPVIRGLDGTRVAILANGLGAQDASGVSQDHATSVEPFLADQIEVLKGPSALLYSAGAIGGVVNVIDGRIPTVAPHGGFNSRIEARYDGVNNGKTGLFRLDAGNERFVLHADGLRRDDGNYRVPGGTQPNSQLKTTAGAMGASLLGDWGYVGLSISRYLSHYGVPNETDEGPEHDDEHEHEHEDAHGHEDGPAAIKLAQTRYDLKGSFRHPLPGIAKADISFGHTDYQHAEYVGAAPETTFLTPANEGRLLFTHVPLAGWEGAFGVQYVRRSFAALGDETFIPATTTRNWGVFLTEQRPLGPIKLSLGARSDRQTASPNGLPQRHFSPISLSAGASWRFAESWHLSLNLDRAQRAPNEEELFANGPHHASNSFEIGDANLGTETARQAEVAAHFHGEAVEAKVGVYASRYDDFIYLATTDQFDHGLTVRQWTQHDARFDGAEAEATFHLARNHTGTWDLRAFGDTVRGQLTGHAGNLPRIPAGRLGTQLKWSHLNLRASAGATQYFAQHHTAPNETRTAGYTLVNAHAAWVFHSDGHSEWEAFVDGSNLTNRKARLATSLFKDELLQPGRSVSVGVRAFF